MNEHGAKRLARDSQRLSAIINLEQLDLQQIMAMCASKFDSVLDVRAESRKSHENIEELHRRLDDAILLLAHKQSGGSDEVNMALDACLQDLCRAFDVSV